jgi:hypothetical protein
MEVFHHIILYFEIFDNYFIIYDIKYFFSIKIIKQFREKFFRKTDYLKILFFIQKQLSPAPSPSVPASIDAARCSAMEDADPPLMEDNKGK